MGIAAQYQTPFVQCGEMGARTKFRGRTFRCDHRKESTVSFELLIHHARHALLAVIGTARYQRLKIRARETLIALGPDTTAMAQRAELAWTKGDAADAEREWLALAAAQPLAAEWPIKLAHAADMQGEHLRAEQIVDAAWARGVHDPDIAERIAFFRRTNRLSNTAIDDAIASVRDPKAAPLMILRAAHYLLSEGRLAEAREGFARVPDLPRYEGMMRSCRAALGVLEQAQAEGQTLLGGTLSPARDTLLVREPGADTTVIVFTTVRGDCGIPLNAVHALLQPAKVNAIYLFDDRKQFNLGGNTTLGRPYPAMIERLRAQLAEWGTRTLITIGFSAGGFVALRTGLSLKADGALLFSPVVSLHRRPERPIERALGNPEDDARMLATEKYLRRTVPEMMTRLPDEMPGRDCLKTIEIHFGRNLTDMVHVNAVWDMPGITFHPVEGFAGHECLSEILRRGDKEIFARFIEGVRAAKQG